jgi:ABC-type multidrug transport system fused ATPase/permease subunit
MIGNVIGALGVCFYKGPIFTLICFSYFPMMLLMIGFVGNLSRKAALKKLDVSKSLAGFTEESLSL